jgi:hypothetical protein
VKPITWKTWISALALVGIAAGCGGTLTKREYVARGNALCARYDRQSASDEDVSSRDDARRLLDRLIGSFAQLRRGFDELRAPEALRPRANDWREALGDAEMFLRDNHDVLVEAILTQDDNDPELRRLEREVQPVERHLRRSARRLHIRRCAEALG